jgi:hypothetical protein
MGRRSSTTTASASGTSTASFTADGGPAIARPSGEREWYRHNLRHRDDGPAIERPDGSVSWYRDGVPAAAKPRLPDVDGGEPTAAIEPAAAGPRSRPSVLAE